MQKLPASLTGSGSLSIEHSENWEDSVQVIIIVFNVWKCFDK